LLSSRPLAAKPKVDRVTSLYAKRPAVSVETTLPPPSASSQERKQKAALVIATVYPCLCAFYQSNSTHLPCQAREKLSKENYAAFKEKIALGFKHVSPCSLLVGSVLA
jgi:hypothetical protein